MPEETERQIDVVICWHMHQPCYRVDDRFAEPWVYLHGLKDYAEMAAHIESVPGAKAVINFVPVLLDQLEIYCSELQAGAQARKISDPLLRALAEWQVPQDPDERAAFVQRCFQVNEQRVLARFPSYLELAGLGGHIKPETAAYLSDQFLYDALVWLHLAWLGEHRRQNDPRVARLMAKGRDFTAEDGGALLEVTTEEICSIIPRYRKLAETGQIELCVSPWAHPILPLLLDIGSAREAMPDIALPDGAYPSGTERAAWHVSEGLRIFERHFGHRPQGCWPPEGAVSNATLGLLADAGFRWTASGGSVLQNSLAAHQRQLGCHHIPFQTPDHKIHCFFRDDEISDLIGFVYKDWTAEEAVDDLIGRLEAIAGFCEHDRPVVSVILDGENAWEHYQHNAFDFLQGLYARLADHPQINLTTFADRLADNESSLELPGIGAGSWVYGNLSTWIGHPDKNRAWELLFDAKAAFDEAIQDASEPLDELLREKMGICEGSDWFWWLGDHHSSDVVARFDGLYRAHMESLYRAMMKTPKADLSAPLSAGSQSTQHHAMLPSRTN